MITDYIYRKTPSQKRVGELLREGCGFKDEKAFLAAVGPALITGLQLELFPGLREEATT